MHILDGVHERNLKVQTWLKLFVVLFEPVHEESVVLGHYDCPTKESAVVLAYPFRNVLRIFEGAKRHICLSEEKSRNSGVLGSVHIGYEVHKIN